MPRLRERHLSRDQDGFTLIELLIVIVILGILAGIAIFAVSTFKGRASGGAYDADQRVLQSAIAGYYAGHNSTYPSDLKQLVDEGYLTNVSISADKLHLVGNGYTITFTPGDPPTLSDKSSSLAAGGTPTDTTSGSGGSATPTPTATSATPPGAPGTPSMTQASDSGLSHTDGITMTRTPTFTGSGAADSAVIKLFAGNTLIGSSTASSAGAYSITSSTLADGTYTVTATQTTSDGTSGKSPGLPITIDNQVSAPVIEGPVNTPSSKVPATSAITGTASEAGGVITVTAAPTNGQGATVTATGTPDSTTAHAWSTGASTGMASGTNYTATAKHEDVAGNVSTASASFTIRTQ